jgi:hypothetical protein
MSDYNAVVSKFTTNGGNSTLTLAGWQAATNNDLHSFVATAANLFVDPASSDYRLKSGSPAINKGTNSQAPLGDLIGLPRPAGGLFDIGAYEYGALRGDFNRDGAVNAGDYVLWRNSFGSSGARYAGADASGNGIVDQADLASWRAGFGTTSTGSGSAFGMAAVPEPRAMALIILAILVYQSAALGGRRVTQFTARS